jgi:hypothetical protein
MSLAKKHGTNQNSKRNTTSHQPRTNNLLSPSLSYLTMSKSPGRSKETSASWNKADRNFSREKVDAGIIDINNTTPSYIESIRLKFWGGKKPVTFRDNYRKFASSLTTEQEASGARVSKFFLYSSHAPTPTNSPVMLPAQLLPPRPPQTTSTTSTTLTTPMTPPTTTSLP